MSFKYRFIISFVLIEIFFILLIVSVNFITISNSSKKLIDEKIESNTIFLEQLVKVPISIYDMAALDDLVDNSTKYMNSVVILDNSDRVLADNFAYPYLSMPALLKIKENKSMHINDEYYEIIYKQLFEDDIYLGSLYIIFDISSNIQFIENNKQRTLLIIFLEILISTILSYIIGSNLTKKLTKLSDVALKIGKEVRADIPFTNSKDEIGILSKSMYRMQENLIQRNKDLKDSNKILRKQKSELVQANKAKDDFLANMSHELKTPLNSINVISDIMKRNRENNLNEKQIKNLGIINKCGKDLLFLINDILDLSKLEAGQILLNNDNINVKEFFNGIYDMFYPQTLEKNIEFILTIDDKLINIYSDSDRLKQIIKNLLSNSLKFTHNGKISMIIEDLGKDISIKIKDQGIGIPLDKLEHIFDRFKQVDGSTTRKYGGTGLGLSICKELAHLLKGNISVISQVNKGSEFTLIIPKNEDLLKGLEVLDLNKADEKYLDKEIINKLENSPFDLIVFNNNPVYFINLIIKLKNQNKKIKQISNLSDIKSNDLKLIIDIDSLSEDDILLIEKNNINNIIALSEKDIDKRVLNRVILELKKPLEDADYSKLI